MAASRLFVEVDEHFIELGELLVEVGELGVPVRPLGGFRDLFAPGKLY